MGGLHRQHLLEVFGKCGGNKKRRLHDCSTSRIFLGNRLRGRARSGWISSQPLCCSPWPRRSSGGPCPPRSLPLMPHRSAGEQPWPQLGRSSPRASTASASTGASMLGWTGLGCWRIVGCANPRCVVQLLVRQQSHRYNPAIFRTKACAAIFPNLSPPSPCLTICSASSS